MNKKRLIYLAIISLTIITIIYICFNVENKKSEKCFAQSGILNLSGWNWKENKIIDLNGEWFFYPGTLVEDIDEKMTPLTKVVPHWWEEDKDLNTSAYGFGTYTLEINGLEPFGLYGIDIADEVTSYTLYVNNKKVISNGIPGKSKETYLPYWEQKTGIFQADRNGSAKFVIEIANFYYYRGGFWSSPKIGSVEDILENVQNGKNREVFLFTSILIWGLINLGLFITYKKNKATIYLSLFCFSIAFRTLLIGQRLIVNILPVYSWHVLVRLEYFLGYLLLPLFGLFVIHLFDIKLYSVWLKRFFYFFILYCFIIVLFPSNIYSTFMEPYKWAGLIFALYFAYLIYKANRSSLDGAELMLIAIAGMILSILKENIIGGLVSWMPYASLNFIFCFSLINFKQFLELIKKKEVLEASIIRDPLTGLFNRTYLMEIDSESIEVQNNQKRYFMFLDIDDFKYINDTYGHKIGDFILQEVGRRFKKVLRSKDIICRYGGDEFIIIIAAACTSEVRNIAERIINEIHQPFEKDRKIYHVGISIGISVVNGSMDNIDAYIKGSDEAMYMAKKKGKNQYFFID